MKNIIIIFALLFAIGSVTWYKRSSIRSLISKETNGSSIKNMGGKGVALKYYGDEMCTYATQYNLPGEYLMASIVLECSGRKPCPSRYEKTRFVYLKNVRDGKRKNWEEVQQKDIADASDEALKNLASSWGPFQIMGYHAIGLSHSKAQVKISDLRGQDTLKHSVRCVNENYGDLLRKKTYKDTFHIHNTGKPFPKYGWG